MENRKIKNLIFDNGNVLSLFSPDYLISQFFTSDQELIKKVVFGKIWNQLDENTIEEKEALKIWKEQLPERLHIQLEKMFNEWHHYLVPKEDMYQYMLEIKDQYHFYLLSNAGIRHQQFMIPALDLMEGAVVSYEICINKPDPRIYNELLTRYHLDPKECLMIDDKEENIIEARKHGIAGFVYRDNIEDLKKYIQEMGE